MGIDFLEEENIIDQLQRCFDEGLTQSEIMTRMQCPRKWYFQYVHMVKKQGTFSWNLLYGGVIHEMLEQYYTGKPIKAEFKFDEDVILTPYQIEELDFYTRLANITIYHHNKHWETFDSKMVLLNTEEEYEYRYQGVLLKGKIDLQFRPNEHAGVYIMDHKTTYDFNPGVFLGWGFRFQFMFYAWLVWKVTGAKPIGMYVNAIKRPALRKSKKNGGETDANFIKRIDEDMALDRSKYFVREKMPFDAHILERFERFTLDPILYQFKAIEKIAYLSKEDFDNPINRAGIESLLLSINTESCYYYNKPCPFLDLCQNNFHDFSEEYIHTTVKHPELGQ